jgi:hypothetical protein
MKSHIVLSITVILLLGFNILTTHTFIGHYDYVLRMAAVGFRNAYMLGCVDHGGEKDLCFMKADDKMWSE